MRRGALVIAGCMILSGVSAQDPQQLPESLIEIMAESAEKEINIEELTETWQFFLENRININSECTENLRQLGLLTEFQIQSILEFRKQNGPVYSIYELLSVDGFDRELLQKLEPFLAFGESGISVKKNRKVRRELLLRALRTTEKARGYLEENGYTGSPEKYYFRFKQTGGQVSLGITAEKDPGETFFRKPNQAGFDYYSMFAGYETPNRKCRFLLGDFHVRAGQGLVIWQGFGTGKSVEVNQVYRNNQGIRPYSSTDENNFFRGMAGEFRFRNSSLSVFYSKKKIDANLDEQDGNLVFTSFQTSGLHRTASEIEDKHSVMENAGGLVYSFQKNNFSLGFSATHAFFDIPKVSDGQPYKLFLFQGTQITNVGADWKWALRKLFLFGETAYSADGGLAIINGALLKPADQLELSLLYRNFGKKYNSQYGQAFSGSSAINDEQGFYVGVKFWPVAKISLAAYHDLYHYRWLKYQTVSPSDRTETLFQINYAPSSIIGLYLRYFSRQKESKASSGQLSCNETTCSRRFRIHLDILLNEQWSLKNRAEFSVFESTEKENGMLFFQDIKYKSAWLPFSCQIRFAWFDTDSYNCRLYAYENDMLHNYSVPALSGRGVRTYLNGKYSLTKKADIWFKLARTQYFDLVSMGSGLNEITGDRKTEVKLQFRCRF